MAVAAYSPFGFGGSPSQKKFDLSQVAPMPINPGMTGQQAILSRLQPSLDRQRTSLETQLTNQGLTPGTEAWTNSMTDFGNQENDARQQAILQGLTLDQNANQQGFNQAQAQGEFYNQGTGQDFSQNLEGQGQAFNQNLAGQQFGYQQTSDQRDIDAAQHNSTMQGIFGLGSNLAAPILSKAFNLGGNIKNIGTDLGGYTRQAIDTGGGAVNTATSNVGKVASTGLKGALGIGAPGIFGLGAATIPVIGGAIAAGAYIWKKSQVHQTADKWVQGQQAPFDQTWQQIQQAEQMGQIQPQQAQQLKQQNAQNYLTELQKFRAKGGKQKKVGDQALATFRQYYGDPSQYGVAIA